MATKTIGVVIDGATGRLGTTQHLKALLAIRAEGGLPLKTGDRLMPEPVLLGRNAEKLAALAVASGGVRWSLDRDACLADKAVDIYFDATATGGRPERLSAALDGGKHIYTEKPLAASLEQAVALARRAQDAGLKNGIVQDKLFLPQKAAEALRQRLFWVRRIGAARFRLVGVRRRVDPVATAELELPQGDRRRAGPRYVRALALHLRPAARADRRRVLPRDHRAAAPHRRSRQALRCRCRGPRLCDLRAGGRRAGADQLVLGRPRQARRPAANPGGRHQGFGGLRNASLFRPAAGRDPPAVL